MRYARLLSLLLGTLGLVLMSGLAHGDDKPTAIKTMPGKQEVVSEVVESDSVPEATAGRHPRLAKLKPVAVKEKMKNHLPLGCHGNFNDYSCSSLPAEYHFLFGSCRTFFGEACLKGPPPSPVPGFDPQALGLEGRGIGGRWWCPNCK
jgi:hypothetical protein